MAGEEITSRAAGGRQIASSTVVTTRLRLLLTGYAQRHLKSFHSPKDKSLRLDWRKLARYKLCILCFHLLEFLLSSIMQWLISSHRLIVSTGQVHCMLPSNYSKIDRFYL